MDKRDMALQKSCPTISVPLFSPFTPLAEPGERVLVARNGTFLETKRGWGYFIRKIGEINVVLPFGHMEHATVLFTPKLPMALLYEFGEMAKKEPHVEIGASVIWNEKTNLFRLVRSGSDKADDESLDYRLPPFLPGDHLVVDCHSHADGEAFFSPKDNKDDGDAVKFSYVVGNCDKDVLTTELRLCIKGIFETV